MFRALQPRGGSSFIFLPDEKFVFGEGTIAARSQPWPRRRILASQGLSAFRLGSSLSRGRDGVQAKNLALHRPAGTETHVSGLLVKFLYRTCTSRVAWSDQLTLDSLILQFLFLNVQPFVHGDSTARDTRYARSCYYVLHIARLNNRTKGNYTLISV